MPFARFAKVLKKVRESKTNDFWRGTVLGRVRSLDDRFYLYVCVDETTGAYFMASEGDLQPVATPLPKM